MIPCEKCGARGQDPCLTASGLIARATHKVRILDEVGELERLITENAEEATWILPTDRARLKTVLMAAHDIDRAIKIKAERAAGETMQLLDVATGDDADIDGTLIYALDAVGRGLDSLGLSAEGRMRLQIETDEEDTDEVAELRKRYLT